MAEKRGKVTKRREPPPPPPKYEPPNWAGKPPAGMHLDVSKSEKLIEKLIIDGKNYFLFGRLRDHVDFPLDHASCSRVHAALIFHRHLKRMFIIDLGSTHGTFVGSIRVDPNKPVQVQVDTTLHFGASTRCFTLRERPSLQSAMSMNNSSNNDDANTAMRGLLGLPEEDTEVDDLTEYNTAHNRRVTLNFEGTTTPAKKRKKSTNSHVGFKEGEEIINPEPGLENIPDHSTNGPCFTKGLSFKDIDPSIGRFRNLVQTEVIVPNKKAKQEPQQSMTESITQRMQSFSYAPDLYADIPTLGGENPMVGAMSGKITITSAPEVESPSAKTVPRPEDHDVKALVQTVSDNVPKDASEPKKKKYAKEAWPGKKPGPNLLSV